MTLILTQLTANNSFILKQYRLAEGYGRRKKANEDFSCGVPEHTARLIQKSEENQKLCIHAFPSVDGECMDAYDGVSASIFPEGDIKIYNPRKERYRVCDIGKTIPVVSLEHKSTSSRIVQESYYDIANRQAPALDLIKKSQQEKIKTRKWGQAQSPKKFSYAAGKKIREGGAIIDRFCGKECSTMITLTVPGGTPEALDAVARWSGYLVNRLLQVVRRVPKTQPPVYWFFVWEHQKRGALHLHFCLGWKVSQLERENLAYALRRKWFDVLLELLEKDSIDVFARKGFNGSWRSSPSKWQAHIVQVRYSVAAYFSKYAAKNAEYFSSDAQKSSSSQSDKSSNGMVNKSASELSYPSRYWGSSQTIKKWSKFLSRKRCFEACDSKGVEDIVGRIREFLSPYEFENISVTSFEVTDDKTGLCISSGTVESYSLPPKDYPFFWAECMDAIMEREFAMDAFALSFLHS